MKREQTLIPVDMDQEEVALRFQKYALISAAVVDDGGRLVGMITVDDIVHIIQEEAGEDIAAPVGRGRRRHQRADPADRAHAADLAGRQPRHRDARRVGGRAVPGRRSRSFALLAVLMPIVSGMGGNAGTQTLAVVVRALATNQLTSSNTARMIVREFRIAAANGVDARRADRAAARC